MDLLEELVNQENFVSPEIKQSEVRIETNILDNGVIEQIERIDHINYYVRYILDTREKACIDALKQLGWTPPKERIGDENRN